MRVMKVLLVEDDTTLAETVRDHLSDYYQMDVAHTGTRGVQQGISPRYDAIILDIMLPGLNGVDVCKYIRAKNVKTPILVLTARDSVDQKVAALDAGADDYLTKPFHFTELLARLRAITRRPHDTLTQNVITIGPLSIDIAGRTAAREGQALKLRRKEFALLEYLARHAGKVITRKKLREHVWNTKNDTSSNTLDVHINHVRAKVDHPFETNLIKTVPGVGYKLERP